jgi:hypothetical protein
VRRSSRADLGFTDLETAIRSPEAEAATRQGVFLHAADPVVYVDLSPGTGPLRAAPYQSSYSTTVETAIETPCETTRLIRFRTPDGWFLSSASSAITASVTGR